MSDRLKRNFLTARGKENSGATSLAEEYIFSDDESFAMPADPGLAENNARAVTLEKNKLHNFLDVVIAIGNLLTDEHTDVDALEHILAYAQNLTNADAGTIYMVNEQTRQLEFRLVVNRSLHIAMNKPNRQDSKLCTTPIALFKPEDGQPVTQHVSCQTYHQNATILIHDAYYDKSYDFSGTKKFDELNNYRSKSFLTTPLRNRKKQVIGIFQLINAQDLKTNRLISFKKDHVKIVEALAALASIALYK